MSLKEAVIAYRKRHMITQREMACRCGVSIMTISNIETDTASPSLITIAKIERVLKGGESYENLSEQDQSG